MLMRYGPPRERGQACIRATPPNAGLTPSTYAETVQGFIADQGIMAIYIEPGQPWQNRAIESFNPRFQREFSDR